MVVMMMMMMVSIRVDHFWNGGEDTEGRRAKTTSSTGTSGGLFLQKQDRACWTLFL